MTEQETQQPVDVTPDETPTLTQAEVDRLIGKTREEARKRAQNELLKSLGVDSVDALASTVTEYKQLMEAKLTEAERIAAAERRAEQLAAQLDAERAEKEAIRQQAVTAERNRTIVEALKTAGALYPDDLLVIAGSVGADFSAAFGDDNTPNKAALDKQINALRKARPALFADNSVIKSTAGGTTSNAQAVTDAVKRQIATRFKF